jgi:hypothetical protein
MNFKDLAAHIPLVRPRPAATAAEQAELRRRILRGQLRGDTAAAATVAGDLVARCMALRDRDEELDDVALVAAAREAHELRCKLEGLEAAL